METKHIPVVLGTARTGRASESVARYVTSVLEDRDDVTTELVDVKDHIKNVATTPPWGEGGANDNGSAWKDVVSSANALILVVPEYNHGYPGELKLLLDSLFEDYKGLPVMLVGVSGGTLGGARVIDHIKPVLIEMHLTPIRESVSISKVKEVFDEEGNIKDEKTTEYVNKVVTKLVAVAGVINDLSEASK